MVSSDSLRELLEMAGGAHRRIRHSQILVVFPLRCSDTDMTNHTANLCQVLALLKLADGPQILLDLLQLSFL